jgi:HPt (histidine-containing phosphotransfer) domain-containing protein
MPREFDEQELLDRIEDDFEFLEETVSMLEEDCPPLLEQVREAAGSSDAAALTKSAHALKGLFANFCAGPATDTARALEMMGRDNRLTDIQPAVRVLEDEAARLRAALQAFLQARKP